jgi:hypothetical protein
MASGYFDIWLAADFGIYAVGVAFAAVATRSGLFSRAVPLLLGASFIESRTDCRAYTRAVQWIPTRD